MSEASPQHSRQRAWQLDMVRRNRCSICGASPLYRDERCLHHYVVKIMRREGLRPEPKILSTFESLLRREKNHWRRFWARAYDQGDA